MKKIIVLAFISTISFAQAQRGKVRDGKETFPTSGIANEVECRGKSTRAVVVSKEGEPLNINDATAGSYDVKQQDRVVGQLVIKSNGEMIVVPATTESVEKTSEKPKVESRFQKRE